MFSGFSVTAIKEERCMYIDLSHFYLKTRFAWSTCHHTSISSTLEVCDYLVLLVVGNEKL
jgi:hypothetical protein